MRERPSSTEHEAERAARLVTAAENALARLRAAAPGDVFAELGESLFWIVALAQARRMQGDPLILGLKWARNRIAHGVLVAAPVQYKHGAQLGYIRLGYTRLGTGPSFTWVPRHLISLGPEEWRDDRLAAAYDTHVSGKGVGAPLDDALALLR